MKLIIGSDHGAVDLKEEVKRVLKEEFAEVEVEDVGTFWHRICRLSRCR